MKALKAPPLQGRGWGGVAETGAHPASVPTLDSTLKGEGK